jgi:hypothetical protein
VWKNIPTKIETRLKDRTVGMVAMFIIISDSSKTYLKRMRIFFTYPESKTNAWETGQEER